MSSISRRIEKLPVTPMLWRVLFVAGIGWAFDAMNQGMVSGVMAAIKTEWNLSPSQLGVLGSASSLGMAFGAAISGMAADRWGRRTVIAITLVVFGLASAISGFAPNFSLLLLFRFLTGVGLGGELPVASTLVSEFSPTKARGRMGVLLESFWAWGWIAASLIAYLLIPIYGWRVGFFLGGIPALYAFYLRRAIPESPRYLEQKGLYQEADEIVSKMESQAGVENNEVAAEGAINKKKPVAKLSDLWSKSYLRRTLVLWVLWFGINFGYYGFVLWIPTLLVGKGFSLVKGFEFTLIMCIAQLPGYYSSAYLIERIGRKAVLVIYLAGTAISSFQFGQATSVTNVLVYGCLLYFFSLGAWGAVYAYTPEVYPTSVRGSGSGWAAAIGRVGAFAAPTIVGFVYEAKGKEAGFTYVFLMLTIVFAVVAAVIALGGIETKGLTLEEINESKA